MGKFESATKSEILRLAKREVRSVFLPLKREVWAIKLKLSDLSKSFAPLGRMAKEQMRKEEAKKVELEATPEEVRASRISPERIRNLRMKKGITQRELGILTGVTLSTVAFWERMGQLEEAILRQIPLTYNSPFCIFTYPKRVLINSVINSINDRGQATCSHPIGSRGRIQSRRRA